MKDLIEIKNLNQETLLDMAEEATSLPAVEELVDQLWNYFIDNVEAPEDGEDEDTSMRLFNQFTKMAWVKIGKEYFNN